MDATYAPAFALGSAMVHCCVLWGEGEQVRWGLGEERTPFLESTLAKTHAPRPLMRFVGQGQGCGPQPGRPPGVCTCGAGNGGGMTFFVEINTEPPPPSPSYRTLSHFRLPPTLSPYRTVSPFLLRMEAPSPSSPPEATGGTSKTVLGDCGRCGSTDTLKFCSRCHAVRYCGPACQKADVRKHGGKGKPEGGRRRVLRFRVWASSPHLTSRPPPSFSSGQPTWPRANRCCRLSS